MRRASGAPPIACISRHRQPHDRCPEFRFASSSTVSPSIRCSTSQVRRSNARQADSETMGIEMSAGCAYLGRGDLDDRVSKWWPRRTRLTGNKSSILTLGGMSVESARRVTKLMMSISCLSGTVSRKFPSCSAWCRRRSGDGLKACRKAAGVGKIPVRCGQSANLNSNLVQVPPASDTISPAPQKRPHHGLSSGPQCQKSLENHMDSASVPVMHGSTISEHGGETPERPSAGSEHEPARLRYSCRQGDLVRATLWPCRKVLPMS